MKQFSVVKDDNPIVLNDGQVLSGRMGELTQFEIISLANQLYRNNQEEKAYALMQYQHRKFYQTPPEAA